jgi:hypothetical protein
LAKATFDIARTFRKEGNIWFGIRISIATAAMEDIYERLCWVYTTLSNTLVFDHRGVSHSLMFIIDFSKEKIPYLEHFSKKPDNEQESLIQDLQLKDVLCTRTDWINLGRDLSYLETFWYEDGNEKFISIEGVPYQNPMEKIPCCVTMIQEFPICLLEPSNSVIKDILERDFEPLAPPLSHVTLFWLRELQRIEITLHNKLNQDQDAVHTGLLQVMRTKMVDYPSFVKVKKSLSIFINLWEKTFCRSFS